MTSLEDNVASSEVVYHSNVIGLRIDSLVTCDGGVIRRHVIEYRSACAAVVLDSGGRNVLLLRHDRHAVRKTLWELPGGTIEAGESAEVCARREVEEEAGWLLRDVKPLLVFHPEPAFSDHVITLVRGIADKRSEDMRPAEPEIRGAQWVARDSIASMIRSGEIASSWSIIGLLMISDQR